MPWPTDVTRCPTPGCVWRWPAQLDADRMVCQSHGARSVNPERRRDEPAAGEADAA